MIEGRHCLVKCASGDAPVLVYEGNGRASTSSLMAIAGGEAVGPVNTSRRINKYNSASRVHGPKLSVPNGSTWRAFVSSIGGPFGGQR